MDGGGKHFRGDASARIEKKQDGLTEKKKKE